MALRLLLQTLGLLPRAPAGPAHPWGRECRGGAMFLFNLLGSHVNVLTFLPNQSWLSERGLAHLSGALLSFVLRGTTG